MSTASPPAKAPRPPVERALLAWLCCVLASGAGWVWAVTTVPAEVREVTAWGGGGAALALCLSCALTVYFAARGRWDATRFAHVGTELNGVETELYRIGEESLPILVRRAREGAPLEVMLGEIRRPANVTLQRLLHTVAAELHAAEQRTAAAAAATTRHELEAARLTDVLLPEMVRLARDERASRETVLAALERPADAELDRLLEEIAEAVTSGERRGGAAMAACANAAARVQAQTTSLLAELREMEHRYGDDKVFADLLEIDHRVSQLGRLADSIALLSGGRTGRRWTKPIVMESVLRGAMGRIDAYRRVRLHNTSKAAVVGYAAEGVMHALAELMDNATTFSAHGSEVHVYLEEEDAGVIITIEDSGLGMRKRERQRAESLVAGPFDLRTMPGTRLGLAVVGRLNSKYGLKVNFRPSSRGGTGVVMMIPRQLVTQQRPDSPPAALTGRPTVTVPAPAAEDLQEAAATSSGGDWSDLPKRPRGAALAAAGHLDLPAEPAPPADIREAGARFAAFRQAGKDASQTQDER
ncbi:signal transduction histidine kinase [Actinocorallia herbida]|uniref:histidine kinase n=1 Tax=Actinocorallia herbida TaxID=58109 RepID=A0A3N1D833_9ACTN|nr:ATP-binding protein [Actinocorallia herbida]ROO89629.1 signal transduction histidine kinase [Actinocorallia herbida]